MSLLCAQASASLTVSQQKWKNRHLGMLGTLFLRQGILGPLGQLLGLSSRDVVSC